MIDGERPSLAALLSWLGQTPAAFRAEAAGRDGAPGQTHVDAVVGDLLQTLTHRSAPERLLQAFVANEPADRRRLAWVLRACWLLWHPSLRRPRPDLAALRRLLVVELAELAVVVDVAALDTSQDRREELVRRVVRACGRQLVGETATQARDRLAQVDAVEQARLLAEAEARERRAREVREALARKAAEEAAAKVSRE